MAGSGAGGLAQQLRVLAILSNDMNSDPRTHIESYNILVAPDLGSSTFFWPQELPGTQCTHIHAGNILIKYKNKLTFKNKHLFSLKQDKAE